MEEGEQQASLTWHVPSGGECQKEQADQELVCQGVQHSAKGGGLLRECAGNVAVRLAKGRGWV